MARSPLHPQRAVAYYKDGRHKGNEIPAILVLFGVLVLLLTLRRQALPTSSEAITLGLGAGVVVVAGMVAPNVVVLLLAAALVAAALGTPQLGPALDTVSGRVTDLTHPPA